MQNKVMLHANFTQRKCNSEEKRFFKERERENEKANLRNILKSFRDYPNFLTLSRLLICEDH